MQYAKKNEPQRASTRGGPNNSHTYIMPIATLPIPQLTEKDKLRFWAKVNKDGPTMPHMDSPCWLWMAGTDIGKYGFFQILGRSYRAHRIALTLAVGPIAQGLVAMHACDNPSCCNPAHLRAATNAENILDAALKGLMPSGSRHGSHTHPESLPRGDNHYARTQPHRLARGDSNGQRTHPERSARGDRNGARLHPERLPRGESHKNAKLTSEKVREIRLRYSAGNVTLMALSREFCVSFSVVQSIMKRRTWAHVA